MSRYFSKILQTKLVVDRSPGLGVKLNSPWRGSTCQGLYEEASYLRSRPDAMPPGHKFHPGATTRAE